MDYTVSMVNPRRATAAESCARREPQADGPPEGLWRKTSIRGPALLPANRSRIGKTRTPSAIRGEPGAQLLGVRMAQIFEESQGLLPGTAGGGTVAGRLMRVTEVNQYLGPVVAIAQVPV